MKLETLPIGPYEENIYILHEDGHVLIIDPGRSAAEIRKHISPQETVDGIVLTHGHSDHTGAVDDLSKDSTGNADFDISDPDGNVLVRVKDGEVKTKNFDSSLMKMKQSIKTGPDFDLTDPDGNVLMRLKNGGIQTKCFDSNDFAPNAKVITVKTAPCGMLQIRLLAVEVEARMFSPPFSVAG